MLTRIAEKIETQLNQLIMLILKSMKWFICLIIPPFVFRFFKKTYQWVANTIWKIVQILFVAPIQAIHEWSTKKFSSLKSTVSSPKKNEEIKKVRITNFKELCLAFILIFKPARDFCALKIAAMTAGQSAFFMTLSIAGFFATASIFINGREIVISEKSRQIAQVTDAEKSLGKTQLPDYYNTISKTSDMVNINVPAYVQSTGDFRDIQMDISITFTDQTTKVYFEKHKYVFVDKLQVEFEPILPEFTLREEGKKILDDAVKREINGILKSRHQTGTVEKVNFHHIMIN